jgi:hypothetical protein
VNVQVQAPPAFRGLRDLLEGQLRGSGAGGPEPDELFEAGRDRRAQQRGPELRQAFGVDGVDHDSQAMRADGAAGACASSVISMTTLYERTCQGSQSSDSGTPVRRPRRIPRIDHGRLRHLAGSLIHNDVEEWTWQQHAPHTLYGMAT